MSKPKKVNETDIELIQDLYRGGYYTQQQLAQKFSVAERTIRRVVKGVDKGFHYDVYSLSEDKRIPYDENIAQPLIDLYIGRRGTSKTPMISMQSKEPDYSNKKIKCPNCDTIVTVKVLLEHLVQKHQRYDLEYLLDG